MKKIVSLILALVMAFTVSSMTAFAAQVPSVSSDTAKTLSIAKGRSYTFKFTVSGASSLSVAVGNLAVLKVSTKKSGYAYLVTVTGVNEGSTGIYTTLPGKKGVCQCVITVSTAPVQTGVSAKYYGATYGCDDNSQYEYVLSHAGVVGGSKYSKTYNYDTAHPDGFEEYYGVPYTEAWRQIVAIRSCFAASSGSAGDGSAYAYFTGSNRVCSDTAKALEAALHEAGYNARLALGSQNGVSHMWVQVYEGGWYNLDDHISASLNAGYSLDSTGYNL